MPTLAGDHGCRVEHTVTVMRSPEELYDRWRDLAMEKLTGMFHS